MERNEQIQSVWFHGSPHKERPRVTSSGSGNSRCSRAPLLLQPVSHERRAPLLPCDLSLIYILVGSAKTSLLNAVSLRYQGLGREHAWAHAHPSTLLRGACILQPRTVQADGGHSGVRDKNTHAGTEGGRGGHRLVLLGGWESPPEVTELGLKRRWRPGRSGEELGWTAGGEVPRQDPPRKGE